MATIMTTPVDEEVYSQLLDIMADEFVELLDCFRDDANQAFPVLQQHIEAAESDAVGAICHKLKSSSKLIGALEMAEFARSLEDYKDDHNQDLARTHLQQLREEYARVQNWLDAHAVEV